MAVRTVGNGELNSDTAPATRERGEETDLLGEGMDWLGHDRQSRIIVDARMEVVWQNEPGSRLIAARHEIELLDGTLMTTNRSFQATFTSFIGDARAVLSTWQVPRKDELGFLLLRATRLDAELVGLTAVRTGAEYAQRFADLDRAYRLTASEHRVLAGLLAGDEAEKLARHHGVSLETTRTHIRNLYVKMGVKSRESLFARALPFRL